VSPPLDPALLALLACPADQAPLAPQGDELVCSGCGRRYPVQDGMPVLLLSAAAQPAGDGR
jgi:uncharacterized protein YbaR (Trm112 family)